MDAPTRELEAYFAGHATADQLQAIEAWLHADPANAKAFMAQLHFRELVGETLREQANADAPIGSVLAEVAKIEAAAEPITLAPEPVQQAVEDDGALSAHELASVGGYLLGKALTSKPAILCYAAAIAIAAIVLINPWGGGEEPDLSASNTQDMPAASAEQTPRGSDVVATLTATHNATWAPHPGGDHRPGALRQGTQLSAGQRLVLTQGFAEITTNDGAIAIIEAPATIQLIDDNALRLHAGKLVGICETESSRGFTVRTPHMDITDLGTRFGVATTRQATEVHVIEGEVQASRANAAPDTKPTTLIANMSARTSADTDAITRIDHDTDRFAALLPTTTPLPGTGFGLAVGDTDPNWQIIAVDGQPLDTPQLLRVTSHRYYNQHFANDPATSQWLAYEPAEQAGDEHTYLVRTTLDLPQVVSESGARLRLTYMADNALRAVTVNGHRVVLPEASWFNEFDVFQHATIDRHFVPGMNTIEFEVVNIRQRGILSATGLRVAWELSDRSAQPDRTQPTPK